MNKEQRRAWRKAVFGSSMTPAEKVVVLALETFADYPEGTNARPGNENLATMCGLKSRVVESALAEAKRLKFIEQTSRANPKRALAAVYRLLSIRTDTRVEDDSIRTDTRVEDDSIRTDTRVEDDFNPHETDFNPHETAFQPAPSCSPPSHTKPLTPTGKKPPRRSSSSSKKSAKPQPAQPVAPSNGPRPIDPAFVDAVVHVLRANRELTIDQIERALRDHPNPTISARSTRIAVEGLRAAESDGRAAKTGRRAQNWASTASGRTTDSTYEALDTENWQRAS